MALNDAVKAGVARVTEILSYACDVNKRDGLGNTPLHTACCLLKPKVVKLLIDHGACVNFMNAQKLTPLSIVLRSEGCRPLAQSKDKKKICKIMELLLNNGARLDLCGELFLHQVTKLALH